MADTLQNIKSVSYDTLQKFGACENETGEYHLTLANGEIIPIYMKVLTRSESENFNVDMIKNTIQQDGSMLFIKANKLEISKDTILTPQYRCRGMTIFCNELINNGKISMTARGCIANGQNILLYKNANGEYETIPAIGGLGAAAKNVYAGREQVSISGNNGNNGINRSMGGGGQGGIYFRFDRSATLYRGGNATSYSGGTGSGGGSMIQEIGTGTPASDIGGAGGNARDSKYDGLVYTAVGGTGNPGGIGYAGKYNNSSFNGTNGTGGLLVIYVASLVQNGVIESKGVNSLNAWVSGGASGGGSINVFYEKTKSLNLDSFNVSGGIGFQNGGSGGNGCLTIGQYRNLFNKILVKYNNQYYSPSAEFYDQATKSFTPLDSENFTIKSLIDNYGIDNNMLFSNLSFGEENFRPIDKFNGFSLIYSDFSYLLVNATKTDCQLIVQNTDLPIAEIKKINSIVLSAEAKTENSKLKIACSGDMGDTWFTIKNGTFEIIPCMIVCKSFNDCNDLEKEEWNHAANEIYNNGISLADFQEFDWNTLSCQKLRFAFVLKRPTYEDIIYLKSFLYNYNEKDYCEELNDNECSIEVFEHKLRVIPKINADKIIVNTIV